MRSHLGPPKSEKQTEPIRAELIGSETCSALGITVQAYMPVLTLCRALVAAGHDQTQPLEAYRGDALCLRVSSIGKAAQLRVRGNGYGFEAEHCRPTAPSMRANAPVDTGYWAMPEAAE